MLWFRVSIWFTLKKHQILKTVKMTKIPDCEIKANQISEQQINYFLKGCTNNNKIDWQCVIFLKETWTYTVEKVDQFLRTECDLCFRCFDLHFSYTMQRNWPTLKPTWHAVCRVLKKLSPTCSKYLSCHLCWTVECIYISLHNILRPYFKEKLL